MQTHYTVVRNGLQEDVFLLYMWSHQAWSPFSITSIGMFRDMNWVQVSGLHNRCFTNEELRSKEPHFNWLNTNSQRVRKRKIRIRIYIWNTLLLTRILFQIQKGLISIYVHDQAIKLKSFQFGNVFTQERDRM